MLSTLGGGFLLGTVIAGAFKRSRLGFATFVGAFALGAGLVLLGFAPNLVWACVLLAIMAAIGARMLLKSPGFTVVAVLTLALGIGANTAIFSVVNFVLLRPLEYANSDQLVMIWERNVKKGFTESPTSFANFIDFRDGAKSVDIASFTDTNFNLTGGEQPERIAGLRVSARLFSMLGGNTMRGRLV